MAQMVRFRRAAANGQFDLFARDRRNQSKQQTPSQRTNAVPSDTIRADASGGLRMDD
jgi:hypothetical protein